MTGVRLLNRVHREGPDGVDAERVEVGRRHRGVPPDLEYRVSGKHTMAPEVILDKPADAAATLTPPRPSRSGSGGASRTGSSSRRPRLGPSRADPSWSRSRA